MKTIAVLLLFVTLAVAADWGWSKCGGGAYDISKITMTPDPPVAGKNLSFAFDGMLSETITSGKVTVNVYWEGIWVRTVSDPICQGNCPIKAGKWDIPGHPTLLPSYTPSGSYRNNIVMTDQNNKQLACVNINFTI
eukprot:TRINITY_DN23037_c0_g1_i1.p1 TRINITY_DN23037_c0_g1~~TRINITY_DN23037_c0_g1_i1.p1  ORF type:complete len:136 (+),score=27.27 TRINITY_DN23037_c0_g1_i1:50-457(+)